MLRALRQLAVLILCAGGLAALLGQLNHSLSPLALTVTLPGLLIAYAALRLPLRTGLAAALLVGLWLDAATPAFFGRHALFLGLAFCFVYRVRWRLPRNEILVGVLTAVFINLALCIALALVFLGKLPEPASGGLRLLADLVLSQLVTGLIGPWFLALQQRALELASAAPVEVPRRFA